jgi:hypothetical protein
MNAKNIKKSLNAKMNHWLKHIDDENIKKVIKDNAIITGGAIVSLLTGEKPNDYDVYFKTKEACKIVADYYVSKFNDAHEVKAEVKVEDDRIKVFVRSQGAVEEDPDVPDETKSFVEEPAEEPEKPKYRPVFLSTNAISLSDDIQIVIRFFGTPEEIHQNYDFVHCTCWYSFYDNEISLPARALESIINKELYYIGSKYPLCSIIRTRKFIQRGWTINAGQYLKMALQLNELNLYDLKVFEDQLVGVDSLYFTAAVCAIKERQEKEPDLKIDNTYLFEVINRIF